MLLDTGRRRDAESFLREALAICRETGTQFCDPKVVAALSRTVEDPVEREALLAEGRAMLERGTVGHNHLWFHRDAIEAQLCARDFGGALGYAQAPEDYTRAEPLPWAELFVARGRALAAALSGDEGEAVGARLREIRADLASCGLMAFLPPVDAVLANRTGCLPMRAAGFALLLLLPGETVAAQTTPPFADYVCAYGCRLTDANPRLEIRGDVARCWNELGGLYVGEFLPPDGVSCFRKTGRLVDGGARIEWSDGVLWRRH
jgi:hypothetical protein